MKGIILGISYNKLWKLMIDKKLNIKNLSKKSGVSISTISRMKKDNYVGTEVLDQICGALQCSIEEIVELTGKENPDA